jgi:hypothetical protein
MINFTHNLALFLVKNAIFSEFFGENIFKIIISVPAGQCLDSANYFCRKKVGEQICYFEPKYNNLCTKNNHNKAFWKNIHIAS